MHLSHMASKIYSYVARISLLEKLNSTRATKLKSTVNVKVKHF